ncbi:MAG: FHA domain-containing protein [Clostridiales bacterium]|nr:FHA domain-containing protein [Clostridiales bacterium]
MKFKTKIKDCQLVVRGKTSFGEAIDEGEFDRFSRVFMRGFLKPRRVKKNQIEFTGPVGVSLSERLKKPITKREFLFIIEQIVVAVKKLYANNFTINHLVMSLQNVYFNEVTREVQFLYFPTTAGNNGANLIAFIEEIVYSVKPADERDNEFAARFLYFFRSLNPFDINKIEAFVAKEDRSVVNTIRKQHSVPSGFMTDKPRQYYEHYRGREEPDEDATGLMDDEEATGLMDDEEATGLMDDEATGLIGEEEATGLLDDEEATGLLDESDGATELLDEEYDGEEATGLLRENRVNVHYPILFRVLTEERIRVNKPVFRIGKEQSYVDYFVSSNNAVSRSHADIITRGRRHFVKDLNSKNRTYINGMELPPMCEVEIHDGDTLKLGNEEFVFRA